MPLFSVIVPMYNVEKYAKQCIESVLSQTYIDFELILVDDGAKDSTPRIIDEYAEKDARIKVLHKENGGLVSARKAGANVACGEYIIPLDGDDWLHAESLQKFADIINSNQDIDLIVAKLFYMTDDGKCEEHKSRLPVGLIDKKALAQLIYPKFSVFPQSQAGKVFKRKLYVEFENRIDNSITIGEDESLTIPMLYKLNAIYMLHECLYYYRYNPRSMTKNRRKEWSTEGLLARIKLLEESLDLSKYSLEDQLATYVAHATINQCLSYFKVNSYKGAKSKTKNLLNNELINKYIIKKVRITNKKEKIAKFALKHRLYLLIKIYSLFW